ncbi:hypothetical protein SGPA1_41262 [Streptomyces misionensis JCM 4497]
MDAAGDARTGGVRPGEKSAWQLKLAMTDDHHEPESSRNGNEWCPDGSRRNQPDRRPAPPRPGVIIW